MTISDIIVDHFISKVGYLVSRHIDTLSYKPAVDCIEDSDDMRIVVIRHLSDNETITTTKMKPYRYMDGGKYMYAWVDESGLNILDNEVHNQLDNEQVVTCFMKL